MSLMGRKQQAGRAKSLSASRRNGSSLPKPAKPRVLVVEDEIFVAWHLESALRELDCAVCGLVPDGESAADRAESLCADLVLMDVNLKGTIDGVEAARQVRQRCGTPVIFITAYSDAATLGRIRQAVPGAAVLAKPVSAGVLKRAVSTVLAVAV